MKREILSFIEKFSREIKEENAAIFAGAGLSAPLGFVNWAGLLEPLAVEIGVDISRENDLVALAQYYKNETNNRSELNNRIIGEFCCKTGSTENHEILARLPIGIYWTTNYDSVIEDTLKSNGKVVDIKYTIDQLSITKPKRDAVVYKMHGDKEHPSEAVLLKEDYEIYNTKFAPFITALSGDLISKTFLFIGFSFTDPNLDYILSRVRVTYNENQRTHYAFIKEVKKEDYDNDADYEYFSRKQQLFLNDLKRYNIQALLIDDYSEITAILKLIEKNINFNNIFISGSAHSYKPFPDNVAEAFISELSQKLISLNNNIVSGFGVGVGCHVINGALNEIYTKQKKVNNDELILRPFPKKREFFTKYRQDMISLAGISIFIFGNKLSNDNSQVVDADGVYEEFKISKDKGNIIVPVGITGYVAFKIWDEVNSDFNNFYPNATPELEQLFKNLNSSSDYTDYTELIDTIINFINEAKRNIKKNK